jgi:VIT family
MASSRPQAWSSALPQRPRRRTQNDVLIAGVAGLVAGAMSMAAGEYVSVSSQSDAEQPDLARERMELSDKPGFELNELADRHQFYRQHDDGGQAGCREILLRMLGDNGKHTRTPPEKGRR